MRKFNLLITLLTGMVISSCSDFLEQLPDQRTELDSPEKVAELLSSAYPKANYITFIEAMSDNSADKGILQTEIINSEPWQFHDVPSRDFDTPDFYWQAAYAAIAAANIALEAIDNAAEQELYSASRGEALIARAYAHFMLVTLYSAIYDPATADSDPGIPYVTEPEKVVIKKYERRTVAYVYEQIEKDIVEGLPLINDASFQDGAPKYHFTQMAAHAFAARFYLFKQDYQKTVDHANLAFATEDIIPYLRPINSLEYRSLEPLVKLAEYTKATQPANLLLVEAPSLWGRSLAGYRYGFNFKLLQTLVWGPNPANGVWTYAYYGNETFLLTPKFREHFVRIDPTANIGTPYNIIPLLTAEELLFNRAEANVMLGNYETALKDLNDFASTRIIVDELNYPYYDPIYNRLTLKKIRDFYQTVDTRSSMLSTILDFKRIEFVTEGIRWFDILRHKIPVVHESFDKKTTLTLGPNDPRRLLQIPQEAQSSGIELNPR